MSTKLALQANPWYNRSPKYDVQAVLKHSWTDTRLELVPMSDIIPQDNAPRKQCTICKEFFPATPEFFRRNPHGMKDGLLNQCKPCKKKKDREYCKRPGVRERSIARSKAYYQAHREEKYAYDQVYNQVHREERLIQQHAYYHTHREEHRIRAQAYNQTPGGVIKKRTALHNRKALKRKAQGSHTSQELQDQLSRQKHKCYYCRVKLDNTWHTDHIVPLSRGGTNDISNLVITCPACNLSKHDKLPHEWGKGGRLI